MIHRLAYLTLDKVVFEDCREVSGCGWLIICGFHANGHLRLGRWFIEHSDLSSVIFSGLGPSEVRVHVTLLFLRQGWVDRFLHQGQFSLEQVGFGHVEEVLLHHVRLLVLIFAVILVRCRSISPGRCLLSVRPLTVAVLSDENSGCLTYCKVVRIENFMRVRTFNGHLSTLGWTSQHVSLLHQRGKDWQCVHLALDDIVWELSQSLTATVCRWV